MSLARQCIHGCPGGALRYPATETSPPEYWDDYCRKLKSECWVEDPNDCFYYEEGPNEEIPLMDEDGRPYRWRR